VGLQVGDLVRKSHMQQTKNFHLVFLNILSTGARRRVFGKLKAREFNGNRVRLEINHKRPKFSISSLALTRSPGLENQSGIIRDSHGYVEKTIRAVLLRDTENGAFMDDVGLPVGITPGCVGV